MRIESKKPSRATIDLWRQELEDLCRQPDDQSLRPCPGCVMPCTCSGSISCTCACHSGCGHAPASLSSDPVRFPIEPAIVPLVYALASLRVCQPCWSCEGHNDKGGVLHKLPRVWFFSKSVVYPDVLTRFLSLVKTTKKLSVDWQVCSVYWGGNLESTFSLEPKLHPGDRPALAELQADVKKIAANLHWDIKQIAAERADELRQQLAQPA